MSQPSELRNQLEHLAQQEGFHLLGVAPAVTSAGFSQLVNWIDAGHAGEMTYFRDRMDAYRHPDSVLQGVRSILVLAMPYDSAPFAPLRPGEGRLARYAWSGDDYHDVIHPKLKKLCRSITDHQPEATARGVVDTAPLMERELAQLAGIGWRGKNTLLLNKHAGSYFFLACVLTDVELPTDQSHDASHCGTCTACLDACPTDAFPQPGVLDATRCISYLTIEHRGPIPVAIRPQIGDWLFGCDICQSVCPWNRRPERQRAARQQPMDRLELIELFSVDEDEFRRRFRRTPLWRTRRRGILRNAAIVLGNQRAAEAIDALRRGLSDEEPVVRSAAAWALGQIATTESQTALTNRLQIETDLSVIIEIQRGLESEE